MTKNLWLREFDVPLSVPADTSPLSASGESRGCCSSASAMNGIRRAWVASRSWMEESNQQQYTAFAAQHLVKCVFQVHLTHPPFYFFDNLSSEHLLIHSLHHSEVSKGALTSAVSVARSL